MTSKLLAGSKGKMRAGRRGQKKKKKEVHFSKVHWLLAE